MRKMKSLIVMIAAASALVVVGSASPVISQPVPERQTITLFDPRATDFEHYLDVGRSDISPGDTILFVEKQYDTETCDVVGKLVGRIQVVRSIGEGDALFVGDFTVTLDGGKITAGAVAKFTEFEGAEPIFAVTGGTGTYKDASGEVRITEGTELCGKRGDLTTVDIGPTP